MALNTKFVGQSAGQSAPYLVGREKIREFADAIGDSNAAYHDVDEAKALGYNDVIAPPTFAFVITYKAMVEAMGNPELGLDYSRVVHGEEGFKYERPLVAGDEVVVDSIVQDIRVAGKNELMTLRQDVKTLEGEHIVSATATIVSRGTAPQAEEGGN